MRDCVTQASHDPKKPNMSRFSLCPYVINFKNHLDELSGQANLLLLANQRFDHVLFFHICKKSKTPQSDNLKVISIRCGELEGGDYIQTAV